MVPSQVHAGRKPVLVLDTASLVPRGRAMTLEVDWEGHRLPIVLLRWARRGLRAYVNLCPHMGVPLDRAASGLFDGAKRHLVCTTHGALFRPADGVCVSGPCAGDHLDALEAVEVFEQIQVFIPPALADQLRRQRALLTALGPRPPAPCVQPPAGPGGSTPE